MFMFTDAEGGYASFESDECEITRWRAGDAWQYVVKTVGGRAFVRNLTDAEGARMDACVRSELARRGWAAYQARVNP